MNLAPSLHQHHLLHDIYYEELEALCDKCNEQIDGPAFTCEICKFWLHHECALQQLPLQISHPSHSQHPLELAYYSDVLFCNGCSGLTQDCLYRCHLCDFNLDLICASSTTIPTHRYKPIDHFCHDHPLTQVNYRKVSKNHHSCFWCAKLLSGVSYGCLGCKLFIHESCLINMPTVIEHPFHPSHPLHIIYSSSGSVRCSACGSKHRSGYSCKKCRFHLDFHCTNLKPSLKHELHQHHLTLVPMIDPFYWAYGHCKKCDEWIHFTARGINKYYRCLECDSDFHFRCLIPEPIVKHKYHRHELILTDFFVEDFSDQYCCDICERERIPEHPVYRCENCRFVAHLGCALNKIQDDHGSASSLVGGKVTSTGKLMDQEDRNANLSANSEIEYFDHEHPLCFKKVIEQNGIAICKVCFLEISDEAYACNSCEYYVHKTCTNLPWEVLHPLHPQHSLNLLSLLSDPYYPCNGCRDLAKGFAYACFMCDFKLDVKCALLRVPKIETQRLKEMEERRPELCLFNKAHQLSFVNVKVDVDQRCNFCERYLKGPIYFCKDCRYLLHERCLGFPREMKLLFHPLHPFHSLTYKVNGTCHVCKRDFDDMIGYSCEQCDLHLHASCAKSLKRVLKSTSHIHDLYYLGPIFKADALEYECGNCRTMLPTKTLCFCMECDTRLHAECALPPSLKSKYHLHPCTLKPGFMEDDSGLSYCDICEEERDPEDHVYYCTECQGHFVAHISCMLNSEEEIADPQIWGTLQAPQAGLRERVSTDESEEDDQSSNYTEEKN